MQRNLFVAVAGNIGAGKSTLTGMLAAQYGWQPFYEANAENPYLADFYQNMQQWSFHSQVFFLGKRLEHHHHLLQHPGSVVQDRTVYEDAEIFAGNLYEQGTMSARDYDAYRRLYEAVSAFLPPPNLLIYLRADVETLMEHIVKRGREFERTMSPNYLERLNSLYDRWIDRWVACPVLTIPIDGLDYQHTPADFEAVIQQVDQALVGLRLQQNQMVERR